MSFATDYATAYRLLREGEVDRAAFNKAFDPHLDYAGRKEAKRSLGRVRTHVMGRIKAAIYAVKMVKEMRRQKVLVEAMMKNVYVSRNRTNPIEQPIQKRPITLFPITVNRTVVQMKDVKND